jgi:hypothetical protein
MNRFACIRLCGYTCPAPDHKDSLTSEFGVAADDSNKVKLIRRLAAETQMK